MRHRSGKTAEKQTDENFFAERRKAARRFGGRALFSGLLLKTHLHLRHSIQQCFVQASLLPQHLEPPRRAPMFRGLAKRCE